MTTKEWLVVGAAAAVGYVLYTRSKAPAPSQMQTGGGLSTSQAPSTDNKFAGYVSAVGDLFGSIFSAQQKETSGPGELLY